MIQRAPCEGPPAAGTAFRPLVRFSAGGDAETASVVIGTAEVFERRPHGFRLFQEKEGFWWQAGAPANRPMMHTMRRAGFSADGHAWHKWHHWHDT